MIIIKKYRVLLLAFFLFSALALNAQQIQNVHFEQQGKQIHIYYDFNGEAGQKYTLKVYCSEDGGDTWGDALKMVSGAVGENQISGNNKEIIWDVLAERETLTGVVFIKITAIAGGFSGNSGVFTDERDSKVYKWVRIGKQVWMAENLNVGNRNDAKDRQKNNGRIEKYCYDDKERNCAVYGGLYLWNEMMQYIKTEGTQGICPDGWHIPTDGELSELIDFLGGKDVAGGKMKEAGNDHWTKFNTDASNSSGFTGLPGGYYGWGYRNVTSYGYHDGSGCLFRDMGLWSSSRSGSRAWSLNLRPFSDDVSLNKDYKITGFSVRCLQD